MSTNSKYFIYTDGGSRGNPGVAGCGAVITDANKQVLKKVCQSLGVATNNEAEYQAVILGLETIKKMLGGVKATEAEIEVRLDSQLVASQLAGTYQIKEERLFPFFIKIWNLRVKDLPKVRFVYIPREQNSIADGLANEAMDSGKQGRLLNS